MSQDSTHPVPGSGTQTDSANPSSSTAQVNASPSPPPTSPAAPKDGNDKKARTAWDDPRPTVKLVNNAQEKAKGSSDSLVQADLARVDHFLAGFDESVSTLRTAQGAVEQATLKFDAANLAVGPALGSVLWPIRMQPAGYAWAKDRKGASDIETAQNVLQMIGKSEYTVPAELLQALQRVTTPGAAVATVFEQKKAALATAEERFKEAKRNVRAAVLILNRSLERAKRASVVPLVPVKRTPPVDQPVPVGHSKKKGA